jgi:PAS domain-containing protein
VSISGKQIHAPMQRRDLVPLAIAGQPQESVCGNGNTPQIDLDGDGYIESMNAEAEQALGWRSTDMIGKPVLALTGVQSGEALGHATAMLRAVRSGRQLHLLRTRFRCFGAEPAEVDCTAKPRGDGRRGLLLTFTPLRTSSDYAHRLRAAS